MALAAMTSDGAFYIWGPPGTGKTKVITAAVRDAISRKKTVLIASHTHVAVDNVLEGLIEQAEDQSSKFDLEPGNLIRNFSDQTRESVSSKVLQHPHLTLNRATAVLTNQTARQTEIERRIELNERNPIRQNLRDALTDLPDIDRFRLDRALRAVESAHALDQRRAAVTQLIDKLTAAKERVTYHTAKSADLAEALNDRASSIRKVNNARRASIAAASELQALDAWCLGAAPRMREIQSGIDALESQLGDWWRTGKSVRREKLVVLRNEQSDIRRQFEWTDRQRQAFLDKQAIAGSHEEQIRVGIAQLDSDISVMEQEAAHAAQWKREVDKAQVDADTARVELDDSERLIADEPDAENLVTAASEGHWLERFNVVDRLNMAVGDLDEEREAIRTDQRMLDDDVAQTRLRLLKEAPIIASTLAGITTQPQLRERRFDIVIMDEVASAEPTYVIYAGSRADKTLALVGDFLQNEPISRVDDAKTPEEEQIVAWQEQNIFELAGKIRDRASADRHGRCVPLSLQYRYPSIIADIVNDFCYSGLLDSFRTSKPDDGPTVTMISTSSRSDKALEPFNGSWISNLGLRLLLSIAADPVVRSGTVGFVCPYRAQADKAGELSSRENLSIPCGTSHKFQGREFDTVIVDLMQDASPARWVGVAGLTGSKRERSAARLLNVALTRGRERLFLIGDWDFICRSDRPGMVALSKLAEKENFRVVGASDILGEEDSR